MFRHNPLKFGALFAESDQQGYEVCIFFNLVSSLQMT